VRVPVFRIDPLSDPRWEPLVAKHRQASVFHSVAWLQAIDRTYGHTASAVTTSPPGEPLQNGLVFCRINSWLTGDRIVSVPFADHCQPLVNTASDLTQLLSGVADQLGTSGARFLEIRPVHGVETQPVPLERAESFCLHTLALDVPEKTLINGLHPSCVMRKIRRSERERLSYEEGRSEALLDVFYRLLTATRLRHGVPVQPLSWFRNLIACMGDALKIRVASQKGRAVAAILTLKHNDAMVFKYGASDVASMNLGGTHALLWRAIQDSRADGLRRFDLGRSDVDDHGLIQFKDRWGAVKTDVTYLRHPLTAVAYRSSPILTRVARQVARRAPQPILHLAGRAFYGHWAALALSMGSTVADSL